MVEYNEQIRDLEDELKKTKYNKRTQHHIGLVKAKIARLKEKQVKRSKGGKKGEGYAVRKTGDGTVVLVGYPSVGKSTLLNRLTNAKSEVAAYAFTTLTCIPGVMEYEFAKIQILDVPGIVRGAADGTGRGKEVLSILRNADLALLLIDVSNPEHLDVLKRELRDAGLRINEKRPDVRIRKTAKGGIQIGSTVRLTKLDHETIKDVLREFRINNAHILIREDISDDQLIDCIEDNKKYLEGLIVLNKIDLVDEARLRELISSTKADFWVSSGNSINIEGLKRLIFQKLSLMRIYLKEPSKLPDMKEPLIIFRNCTIRDVCEKLHRDFVRKFRFARIWGSSVRFEGQKVLKLAHVLNDKDVLELHIS